MFYSKAKLASVVIVSNLFGWAAIAEDFGALLAKTDPKRIGNIRVMRSGARSQAIAFRALID